MDNVTQIVQKVRQAPWRVHRQWIGLFMLGLVVIAMVAAIYLNVTVRATLAGRQIQLLLNPSLVNPYPGSELNSISTNLRINTELESQLAALTSVETMRKRAEEMGFQPATPDDMIFISVPGYVPQSTVDFSSPPSDQPPVPVILPEYTESWFDYFLNQQVSSATKAGQQ
jgi:hypothetical protein